MTKLIIESQPDPASTYHRAADILARKFKEFREVEAHVLRMHPELRGHPLNVLVGQDERLWIALESLWLAIEQFRGVLLRKDVHEWVTANISPATFYEQSKMAFMRELAWMGEQVRSPSSQWRKRYEN